MKLYTAVSVLNVVSLNGFVSVAALPADANYDLDVRGEAVDSESVWTCYYEEVVASRDYDDKIDFTTRDFIETVEDVLYQRASQGARIAWNGVGKDALARTVANTAQQAVDNSKRPPPSANWQKAPDQAKREAVKKPAPQKFPKLDPIQRHAGANPQAGVSKILSALEEQRRQG